MLQLLRIVRHCRIWQDRRGQDFIESALMAGFVALAAGAIMPGIAIGIYSVIGQINSLLISAASN